ncbi:DNA polymerase IV [Blastochloris viridis]|uniref:DNA polymerase IV n=1 Tax=Blastochloris viridis TaxID=1079 RepID=A0A0H5BHX6_BLAVI|nr:DNA polymerase IV [Blastochloris viridis]ALK09371.1 DNA polymerase IV [Blastochloris viridis]BAS00750.1 DNA polymerase IV [Blastochloris viridis]CUU42034.1 DNA polymerase IV [Blastochloris viridis]
MPAFCRDCLAAAPDGTVRCGQCGSPRLACHPELDTLAIAHVDCDAFYAAVEKRDNPALTDQPVIIGGGRRGVVATACYVARTYGVKSAMPMFKALKLCPDAVVIGPDMAKYARVGREVRARMLALTPLVEPLSIDEAFLDLRGTEALHGMTPARVLARFAASIEREVGITVSVGLAPNKFLAKIASDLDKPRGFSVIGAADAAAFLADKPVSIIWGVGKVSAERLAADGLRTVGDLASADEAHLAHRYGGEGLRLARLAKGRDDRPVVAEHETKSISNETTFDVDLAARGELEPVLWRLSEKVAQRLKAAGLAGHTVTLKLKTADFHLRTRARALPHPTRLARRIFDAGRELLARETDGTRYRLIGIGVSNLTDIAEADPVDLVDSSGPRTAAMEAAVDALRAKFGSGAVERGIAFGHRRGRR